MSDPIRAEKAVGQIADLVAEWAEEMHKPDADPALRLHTIWQVLQLHGFAFGEIPDPDPTIDGLRPGDVRCQGCGLSFFDVGLDTWQAINVRMRATVTLNDDGTVDQSYDARDKDDEMYRLVELRCGNCQEELAEDQERRVAKALLNDVIHIADWKAVTQ